MTKDIILILDPLSQSRIQKGNKLDIKPDICVFRGGFIHPVTAFMDNHHRITETHITGEPSRDTYRLYSYHNGKRHIIKNNQEGGKSYFTVTLGKNNQEYPQKNHYVNRIVSDNTNKMRYGTMVRKNDKKPT